MQDVHIFMGAMQYSYIMPLSHIFGQSINLAPGKHCLEILNIFDVKYNHNHKLVKQFR